MLSGWLAIPWATGLQSDGRDLSLFLREGGREGFEFIFVLTNCPSLPFETRMEEKSGEQKSIFSGNFLSPFVRPFVRP